MKKIPAKPLPYVKVLPMFLERLGLSYRDLDKLTGKSPSYWSQTLSGRAPVPKNPAVYERLAEIFSVSPFLFAEYAPLKAAKLVMEDSRLAYDIANGRESFVPIKALNGFNVSSGGGRPRAPTLPGADFAVVVKGDSLKELRLLQGDLVYLSRTQPIRAGRLVLARQEKVWLLAQANSSPTGVILSLPGRQPVEAVDLESIEAVEVGSLSLK